MIKTILETFSEQILALSQINLLDFANYENQFQHLDYLIIQQVNVSVSDSYIMMVRSLSFLAFILILSYILTKLKVKTKNIIIVTFLLCIVSLLIIDFWALFGILFAISILLIIIVFVPLGDLKYVKFDLDMLRAIEMCISERNKAKENKRKNKSRKLFLLLFSLALGIISMSMLFSQLTVGVIVLFFFAVFLLIWMNNSTALVVMFRKLFVYSIFVPIVILSNNQIEVNSILKIFVAFIAVFFCAERIISIVKEIRKRIDELDTTDMDGINTKPVLNDEAVNSTRTHKRKKRH